jgi:hypothetical protein
MTDESGFAIRFELDTPGPAFYAGRTEDGALGFAATLFTAEVWATEVVARNFLANGYGPTMQKFGRIVRVEDGVEVGLPVAS